MKIRPAKVRNGVLCFFLSALLGLARGEEAKPAVVAEGAASPSPLAAPNRANSFAPAGGEQGSRREEMLSKLYRDPYPKDGAWHFIGRALSSYWTGHNAEGDQSVAGLAELLRNSPEARDGDTGFHWQAFELVRIVFLFGQEGVYAPGRMSPAAESAAKELLWQWTSARAGRFLFLPENDWILWKSENHHLQGWFSFWGALNLFARDPNCAHRTLSDGATVLELKGAADEYFKRWIRNRATRGLFVECNSPTYAKYSLSGFYNFVDFADDAELRGLAKEFLDLCWAQWALEQIDGKRGGSRHRSYTGETSYVGGSAEELASYHFDLGHSGSAHPAAWCTATSSYSPPPLISRIVRDRAALGNYEIISRQPGLLDPRQPPAFAQLSDAANPMYQSRDNCRLDPACGSILRKTYATPGFVLGVSMIPSLPKRDWSAISMQNRWDGVLFKGPAEPSIFVQPAKGTKGMGSVLNTEWSVMDKGVVLIQRLVDSNATDQRIWFSKNLVPVERDGWIFVEAPEAYAAVKVVDGASAWEEDKSALWRNPGDFKPGLGRWLVPANTFSPIVLEVAPKTDYADFPAFQKEIAANPLSFDQHRVDYSSRHYQNTLALFSDHSQPPTINGQPVLYENPECFSGGALEGAFGGDRVRLHAFGEEHVFDFGIR
jgi:hypothetical protein